MHSGQSVPQRHIESHYFSTVATGNKKKVGVWNLVVTSDGRPYI